MATLINSFVFLYTLCSLGNAIGFVAEETTEALQFHTVQPSSLLPSSTCIRSTQAGLKKGVTLELAHKRGPCSPLKQQGKPSSFSLAEIVKHDKHKKPKAATLHSTNLYVVTVGLGTPVKKVPLSFDTGSDFTWTQCKSCSGPSGHCFNQTSPIFDPTKSSTYTALACPCPRHAIGYKASCTSNKCMYELDYGDYSTSYGFLSKERLTLTPSDAVDDFLFGCGENNTGIFSENESGILGLGHGPVSIVQQTAKKFHRVFSYCIPSNPSHTGFLRFGGKVPKSLVFTPMSSKNANVAAYYGIDILGINLGGKTLPISTSVFTERGAIIDSGTEFTILPSKAYKALRDAYRKALSQYKFVNPKDILEERFDTCHSHGIHELLKLPKASFLFGGGAIVDLSPSGLINPYNSTVFCLAFSDQNPTLVGTIFGSTQQKKLEVVYDLSKGRIGFGPRAGCK